MRCHEKPTPEVLHQWTDSDWPGLEFRISRYPGMPDEPLFESKAKDGRHWEEEDSENGTTVALIRELLGLKASREPAPAAGLPQKEG